MKRLLTLFALLVCSAAVTRAQDHQTTTASDPARNVTREKLRSLLETAGQNKDVKATFRQSDKQPYNFVAVMKEGLTNADSLEVVIGVTKDATIGFRIYPHYKGAYVNLDRAKDGVALMRKLLTLSDKNFLFWGADSTGDVFSGYTFTLESGFPQEAITVVLRSIRNTDRYIGEMRPMIDGSTAP